MNKLILVKEYSGNGVIRYNFSSYLKPDYIDRSAIIDLNPDNTLKSIQFHSNSYGTASWVNGMGIVDCHRWEDEDTVQEESYLSRHYTSLFLNGPADITFGSNKIIPDVASVSRNDYLMKLLMQTSEKNEIPTPIDLPRLRV